MDTNTFEIVVTQEPGVITWNFEELKAALTEKLNDYKGVVYTEDKVKDAKKDIAELRKGKTVLDEKRKEIKAACLEPYKEIETQAKELDELFDAPIKEIDKQVKEFENERKEKVRKEILEFMDKTFSKLPEDIKNKLKAKTYDSSWENATATKKSWKEAIQGAYETTSKELDCLSDIEDDIMEPVYNTYKNNLVLADALAKANELRKQREQILEAQRRQAEEEAKRQAAKEAEEAAKKQEENNTPPTSVSDAPKKPISTQAENSTPKPVESKLEGADGVSEGYTIRITATDEQLKKIKGYIKFVGASFVEVAV